jgi:folate-binding protein YgfZ
MSALLLPHRAVISVTGIDAETLLNGVFTNTTAVPIGERRWSALLTPQGKVIADFIIARGPEGYLLDVDQDAAADLVRRLNLFRLRAKAAIELRSDLAVFAFDGAPDPRSPEAPTRAISPKNRASVRDIAEYHQRRIAAGIAEQGFDFASEEVFPADINMDLMHGVDFKKGCFVGQEVVSRMKRRGTARRRTLAVKLHGAAQALPAPVLAGVDDIGTLTSVAGDIGLARLRIDRLAEAGDASITAGGAALDILAPDWLAGEQAAIAAAKHAKA